MRNAKQSWWIVLVLSGSLGIAHADVVAPPPEDGKAEKPKPKPKPEHGRKVGTVAAEVEPEGTRQEAPPRKVGKKVGKKDPYPDREDQAPVGSRPALEKKKKKPDPKYDDPPKE